MNPKPRGSSPPRKGTAGSPLFRRSQLGLADGRDVGPGLGDIDIDKGTLTVRRTLQRASGQLTLRDPKTARSRRTLPFHGSLRDDLRRHRAAQLQERLLAEEAWGNADDLVFTSRTGRPIRSANLLKAFKRLLNQAGLPERRFHDLRHSTATLLLVQGVPMRVVMEVMGHTQIATTANLYSHVSPAVQADALGGMARYFGEG